jgi:hypothetical protein
MGVWVSQWDAFLAAQEAQQARLSESFARSSMRAGGYGEPPPVSRVSVAEEELLKAQDWLASPQARLAPDLDREVRDALRRMDSQLMELQDALRLDRLPWLHSPVVEARTGLSQGKPVDAVINNAAKSVAAKAEAAMRTAEADSVAGVQWPTFKNGTPMLYKRVPQAGACGWCRVVATRLYGLRSFKEGRAWHESCNCSWAPVTSAEARAYSRRLDKTDGNYYEAAKAVGLWSGRTGEGAYQDVVGERATPRAGVGAASDGSD